MTTVPKVSNFLQKIRKADWTPLLLIWALSVFYCFFCHYLQISALGHTGYYTYTLQALAWRNGQIALLRDYPWLELAIYEGRYYVSFPPVPSIPLFFLTFLFNDKTPDAFLVKLYVLIGCLSVYRLLRKKEYDKLSAAGAALLCSFAGCLLSMTTNGAVWYQAQTLGYCMTMLSLMLALSRHMTPSLFFYALSVGCRPFNVVFGFVLLVIYIRECRNSSISFRKACIRLIPGVVLGLCVAAGYGAYNYARFGNPLEFGHNYLPEFSFQGGIQFSFNHIAKNCKTFILSMPFTKNGENWELRRFGFSFLIASPVYIVMLVRIIRDCIFRKMSMEKLVLCACFIIQLIMLLMHRTFGGFQFGARYTCDLLPYAAAYFAFSDRKRMNVFEWAVLAFAAVFAVYGAAQILLS